MIKIIVQYSIFTLVGFALLFLFSFVVERGINEVDNMIVPCQHGTSYTQGKCRCDGTPYNGTYCSNCMCEHGICSTSPTTPFLNSDYGCRCPTQSKRFGYLCDICNTVDAECKGTCKPDFFGTKCEKICYADLNFENNNTVCNTMRNSGGKCNTCHGHGTCENGDCTCDKDWFSDDNYDCVLTCPGTPTCSGHGVCQLYGSKPGCLCEDGWNGEKCNLPCPGVVETGKPCNGNGICNVNFETGITCDCLQKFRGDACQFECPGDFVACNGHGTCDDTGVCTCDTNVKWSSPSCKCSDELTCNLKGECNSEEQCVCFGHNTGEKCLECEDNWHGNNCDMYCDPYLKNNVSYSQEGGFGCYGHGTCLVEDSVVQCTCNLDATRRMVVDGALQDVTSYYEPDMNCGECEDDYFPKQFVYDEYGAPEGYVAPCENKCEPASCNHNGICNHLYGIPGEHLCSCRTPHLSDESFCTECEANWYPLDISNEQTCHRYCVASGDLPDECDGTIDCVQCNGHGTCSDEGNCLCEGAYTGDQCQILCEGQNGLICGGHGACGSNDVQQLMEHEFRELGDIPLYSCTCDPQDPVDADSRIDWDEKLAAGLVNGTLDPPPNPQYFGETCDFFCLRPPWENSDECNGMGNCSIIPIRTPLDQTISCHTDLDCQTSLTIQQITSGDVTWSDSKGPFCHKQDDIEGCEKSTDDCYEILLKQRPRKMRSEECVTNSTCYAAIEAEDWYEYCVEVQKDLQPELFENCNSVVSFCPAKTIPTHCQQMVDYTNGVDVSYKLNFMYEFDKKHYPFRMSEIYRSNESALLHDDAEVAFQDFDHSIDLRVDDSLCERIGLKYPTIDTVRENKQYICNGEISDNKVCSGILDESSGVFYNPFTVVCKNFNESFSTYSEAMANRPTNCKIIEKDKDHVFTTGGQEHIDTLCQTIQGKFPQCIVPEPCDFKPCSGEDYTCENSGSKAICSTLGDLNSTCKVGVSERISYSSYSCDIQVPDTTCPNQITHYTNVAQHCKDNNPILSSIPVITNDDTIAIIPGEYIHFHFKATDEITTGTRLEIGDAVRVYVRQGQIQLNEAETLQACPITTPECNNIWAYNADTWYYLELKFNSTHVTMKRKDTGVSITKPLRTTNPMIYVTTIPGSSVVEYRDIYSENDIASPFSCTYPTCELDVSYREVCSDIIRNLEYPSLLEPKHDPLTTCSNYFDNSRIPVNEEYEIMEDIYALNWTAYCAFYTDMVGDSTIGYETLEGYTECQEFVDPLDGDKTCIDNALSYDWETSCQDLLEARIPQNIKDACPKQCYNHLLTYNDCDDMFDIFSSDKQVIDKCSVDWYDYCLQDSKGTLQGTCSAVECSCDYETYEGVTGEACELHCSVASDSTACAEGSNLGKCVYTAAQKQKMQQPDFLFRDVWALEGECQCFNSEGSRSCDIKCFQCNNETYNGGQIGICDNTRGTCDCLPPFVEIESYTEVNWRGKNTTKIERVYNTGNITGKDLFRIRMMQGRESFIKNALEISSGVPAYDGTQDWMTLFYDFVDNPTNYYCLDKPCDYGHSTLASNLDSTSSRFNFDCSSTCPGTDETTRIPCSGRGVCGENGQCVCDPANVIVGQNESGFKRVYQVMPGVEITDSRVEISSLDRTGYRGDGCEKTCRGYDEELKDMSTICSGHGKCDLSGECACELGYLGTDCEFKCPGFEEGDDTVCNGHGTCQFASFKYSDSMFPGVVQNCKYEASKTNCMLYAELQDEEFTQESREVTTSVSYQNETIITMDSEKCINRIDLTTIKKDCSEVPFDDSGCSAQECDTGVVTYTRNCEKCGCDPGDIIERNCTACTNTTIYNYMVFDVTETPVLFPNGSAMIYEGVPVVEKTITNRTIDLTECGTCLVFKECATCKTCYEMGDINCVCSDCGTSTIPESVILKFNNIEETFSVVNNTIQTKPICTDQITIEFPQDTNATVTLFEVPSDGMCVPPGRWEFYNESAEKVCITKAASNLDEKVQYSLLTGLKEYGANCTSGYYDIMTGQCQEAELKPMIKTWFYSDIGTYYEQRVETTCIVLPGKNVECAICDCFSDSTVGFWGNVLCNSCLRGYGNEQCLKECPGGATNMCNGHGSCIYGSVLEQEIFQPADCVCGGVSKPTGGICKVTRKNVDFVFNQPIPGDSYLTEERAEEACCLLDNIFDIETNNYCRGFYYDGSYTLIMGYISHTQHTYDIHWSKEHEAPYVMDYSIGTLDNYQQLTRSVITNCTTLEEIFFTGKDTCPHYDSDDCSRCEDQFNGKDCTLLCHKCLLGGTCVPKPSDETSSKCQCSGLDGLSDSQCCPIGFKVTKMLDWNVKTQEAINEIKITKTYDAFTDNELDAAYWCDPCPGITPSSWLNKDAYFDICMGNGHCETNRFTMENQCQCDEPWAGLSCMCHSDYDTAYVDERTPYGCGAGKRCIVTNEEFYIPDLIRTTFTIEPFGTDCFGKPINGTNDAITDAKCVEYPNQPKNSEGLPYLEDYYMSFDNNAVFNTHRQMVFDKIMVIDRKGYSDFGKKNNVYKNLHIDKVCSTSIENHVLNDTMWDQMVDECSILCEQKAKCNYFSLMAYGGTCDLYEDCTTTDKKFSYVFELTERDIRKKCTARFPCHMGEGPCTDDTGCAGSLTCTTEENDYFDKSKVYPSFGFCHHEHFTGISCVLDDTKKITSDSIPFSGRMIYDVDTGDFHENIEFGRYTPIIMDANDRIIIQPETYKCPIGSYAVPGVFTDFGFGMNETQMVVVQNGLCQDNDGWEIFHPSNNHRVDKFESKHVVGSGYSCGDPAIKSSFEYGHDWLEDCATSCIQYYGFELVITTRECRCFTEPCKNPIQSEPHLHALWEFYENYWMINDSLSTDEMLACYNQCKLQGYDHIFWQIMANNGFCACTTTCESPQGNNKVHGLQVVKEKTNTFCAQCPHGQYSNGETFIDWEQTTDNMKTSNCAYFFNDCVQCGGSLPNKTYFEDCGQCGPLVTYEPDVSCGGCKTRPLYKLPSQVNPGWTDYIRSLCQGFNACNQFIEDGCPVGTSEHIIDNPVYELRPMQYPSLSHTFTPTFVKYYESEVYVTNTNWNGDFDSYMDCGGICYDSGPNGGPWYIGFGTNGGKCVCITQWGFNNECGSMGCISLYGVKQFYTYSVYVGQYRNIMCNHYYVFPEQYDCASCWHESGCKTCIGPDNSQDQVCNSCKNCEDTKWFKPPCEKCPVGKTSDIGSATEDDCYKLPLNYVTEINVLEEDDSFYRANRILTDRGGARKYPIENVFRIGEDTDGILAHCFDLEADHEWCEESEDTTRLVPYQSEYDETTDCNVCGDNMEYVASSFAEITGCQRFTETNYLDRGAAEIYRTSQSESGLATSNLAWRKGFQCGDYKDQTLDTWAYEGYCGWDILHVLKQDYSYSDWKYGFWQTAYYNQGTEYEEDYPYPTRSPFCRGRYNNFNMDEWENFDTESNFILEEIHQFDDRFAGTCGTYDKTLSGEICFSFIHHDDHRFEEPGKWHDYTPYTTSFNQSNNVNATCGITPLDSNVRMFQVPQYDMFYSGYCPGQEKELKGNLTVEECFGNCSSWDYFTHKLSKWIYTTAKDGYCEDDGVQIGPYWDFKSIEECFDICVGNDAKHFTVGTDDTCRCYSIDVSECSSWLVSEYYTSYNIERTDNECTCGNTRDRETCDDWVFDDTQSYRKLQCPPGGYHDGVCTDPDAYPLSEIIEATTLQECADNCLADHIAWNGTNCKCYHFAHKYVVTDILDLKSIYNCSTWGDSDFNTYEAIDRDKCSIGIPRVDYKINTTLDYITRADVTNVERGVYPNDEIGLRIDLPECKLYAQENGYSFEYTNNGPFGCSKVDNTIYWKDGDVIKMVDGYCLDDWAYPETGIQSGSDFVVENLVDIRNCHDLCLTHDYKLIAIIGDFSVTRTCICVNAPCDNMYAFTEDTPYEQIDPGSCPSYETVTKPNVRSTRECYEHCAQSNYFTLGDIVQTTVLVAMDGWVSQWSYMSKQAEFPASTVESAFSQCHGAGAVSFNLGGGNARCYSSPIEASRMDYYDSSVGYEAHNIDIIYECSCGCSSDESNKILPPAYTYRMLELQEPVDLFDGLCPLETSLINGGYMMTETILDIKECLKACPKNAFVYDSGPQEGKCFCVGDKCDGNMVETDVGRTYKLLTMRQPEVLFDGYCRRHGGHVGTIDPDSPHDIWKWVERCSRTEFPAAMVHNTNGKVYCVHDFTCTDYYQYDPEYFKTYGLTDVQFAAPECTWGCDFLTEVNEVHYQDDFYLSASECKSYATNKGLTFEFTDNPDQAPGCSKKDNTIYWRDIDMKLETYGYCSNNAQFQANINISNVLEYRQCYEGCKTHGYEHIAVSTSGECKCVELCNEDTYSLSDAGYCLAHDGYTGAHHPPDIEGCFEECLQTEYDFFIYDPNENCYCGHSKEKTECSSWKSDTSYSSYRINRAIDYAWATYSPIDKVSDSQNIGVTVSLPIVTSGVCESQMPISRSECSNWASKKGYTFSDTTSASYNFGCTYQNNHAYFKDPEAIDYFVGYEGICPSGALKAHDGQSPGDWKMTTWQNVGGYRCSGVGNPYKGQGYSDQYCAHECVSYPAFHNVYDYGYNRCLCENYLSQSECESAGGSWIAKTNDGARYWSQNHYFKKNLFTLSDLSLSEKLRCSKHCLSMGYDNFFLHDGRNPSMFFKSMPLNTCFCAELKRSTCDQPYDAYTTYELELPDPVSYPADGYKVDRAVVDAIPLPPQGGTQFPNAIGYCSKVCQSRGYNSLVWDHGTAHIINSCYCADWNSFCDRSYEGDANVYDLRNATYTFLYEQMPRSEWVITGGPTEILGEDYTYYSTSTQPACLQTCEANGFNFSSFGTNSVKCRCSNSQEGKHAYDYGTGVFQLYPYTESNLSVIDKVLFDGNTIDLDDYDTLATLPCDKIVVYDTGEYACTTSVGGRPVNTNITKIYKVERKGAKFELDSSEQVVHDKIKEKYYTLWYNAPDGWILRNVTSDEILEGGIDNWQLPCTNHMEFWDTSYHLQHQWKYYFFGDDSLGHQEYCEGYTEPSMTTSYNGTYYNNGVGLLESYPTFSDPNGGHTQSTGSGLENSSPVWFAPPLQACTDNPWIEGTAPGQRMDWKASYTVHHTYSNGYKVFTAYAYHATDYADVAVRRGDPNQPGRCKPSGAFFKQMFNRTSDLKGCAPAPYTKEVDTLYPLDVECTKTYTNKCERQMGCRNCVAEGVLTNALTFQEIKVETPQGKCTKCAGHPRYGEGCETLIARDFTYENEDCQPHYFVVGVQYEYSGKPSNMFDARDCEKIAPNIGKEFKSGFSNSAPKGCYYNEHYLYHAPDYTLQTSGYPEILYTSDQCSNYSQEFNYTFDTTDSNSVPFGCSQWENAVFFKPFNESMISVQCGAPFSNSTVACVLERDLDCSFQYGCVQKESISEYRYIYNQVPSLEYGLTSQECLGFAQSIQKEMRMENSLERPRGCYTNLGLVMFNTNTSSVVELSYTHDYEERKAMKDWELYTIGVEKNGIKLID